MESLKVLLYAFSFSITLQNLKINSEAYSLCRKCPNKKFFPDRISSYLDQKKLRIWTIFTQWFMMEFLR